MPFAFPKVNRFGAALLWACRALNIHNGGFRPGQIVAHLEDVGYVVQCHKRAVLSLCTVVCCPYMNFPYK